MREIIQKYKIPILILLGCLLMLLILVIRPKEEVQVVKRINLRKQDEIINERYKGGTLKPEKITPISGDRREKTGDTISMEFETPININTLKYTVEPEIPLAFRTYDKENKVLTIFPDMYMWEENVEYTITITELNDVQGSFLKIKYKFYFDIPEKVEMGEQGMEGNYQEEFLEATGSPNL